MITRRAVRRLAIERQLLATPPPRRVGGEAILDLFRALGCVQVDPISVVAPTQFLVLWSRLGSFDRRTLDRLLWQDRSLFHYWAHAASIVMTEDYPIHRLGMKKSWAREGTAWGDRISAWMRANASLRRSILARIRRHGPVTARDLGARAAVPWTSTGWTNEQSVARMLEFLWAEGKIVIAGRSGGARLWDLMDRFLPEWTPRERLPARRVVELATIRAIRALGVATPAQIRYHFTRGRYPDLPAVLDRLEDRNELRRVSIASRSGSLKGPWYVHTDDVDRLEALARDGHGWAGRTTLLSPFDNLICDRKRTMLLWDFDYKIEIYVPKAKRRYGYYVLPILHHDRLVGRVDAAYDKKVGELDVKAIHAERAAPADARPGISEALSDLAAFVGGSGFRISGDIPKVWRGLGV